MQVEKVMFNVLQILEVCIYYVKFSAFCGNLNACKVRVAMFIELQDRKFSI